ncbi:MAG: hypothetical protein ACYDCL_01265 [Myxococcales bacterium]
MRRLFCGVLGALALAACNQATMEGSSSGTGGGTGSGTSASSSGTAASSGTSAGGSSGGAGSSSGGGSCTLDSHCPGGDYCDYSVSACGPTLGSGDVAVPGSCEANCGPSCGACASDADCAPDQTCVNSSCQHLPACSCAFPGPCDAPCALTTPPHDCCPVCLCPSCPSSTGTSGGASGGSTGGSGGCIQGACQTGEVCCPGIDRCVYLPNDTQNCGTCGTICPAADVCQNSACVPAPCDIDAGAGRDACGAALCCGQSCCGAGQICCDDSGGGPARQYPYDCVDADAGCPQPCLVCA